MKALQQYLEEVFGSFIKPVPEKEKIRSIPLYLKGNFDLFASNLAGQKVIWAEVKNGSEITPDQLQKQGQQLKGYLQAPVIFVFENLPTWQRKRLIEKKVGFAEPFQQLYVPELLLQIKDGYRKEIPFTKDSDRLKPPAQFLLLYHLQVQTLEEKVFHQIAGLLNYSPMTVTRAVKELAAFSLLEVMGSKEKMLRFENRGRQLWDKALPFLTSPVRDSWLTENIYINEYFRTCSDTALAAYTMLAETKLTCWAVGKDAYRVLKSQPPYKDLHKNYGDHKLEIWHYNPVPLSPSNEVDKLSLYLSMRHEEDERVQGALQNLINEMTWL